MPESNVFPRTLFKSKLCGQLIYPAILYPPRLQANLYPTVVRLVEESLTAVSTCSHLMENLLKVFYCQALVL